MSDRRLRVAGAVLLGGFIYIAFEAIAARAWIDPPYDWARNLISDLGFADCAEVDGDRICSPLHPLMNAGFLVQGTVFTVGSVLVTRIMLTTSASRALVLPFLVVSGVGTFLVGVFHQSLGLTAAGLNWLHVTAAVLAIGPGNVGIVLLGAFTARSRAWRWYGLALLVIGTLGLVAALFLVAKNDLGVGLGFVERLAVYPLNTWTVGTAIGLLVTSASPRSRAARLADEASG